MVGFNKLTFLSDDLLLINQEEDVTNCLLHVIFCPDEQKKKTEDFFASLSEKERHEVKKKLKLD